MVGTTFLKGGGVGIQAKISKRGVGLNNFWIKEGVVVKISRRGGGVWIPGHNFPSISNFIFSFSQQMTFFGLICAVDFGLIDVL